MPLSGKYDFVGIKKAGTLALTVALSSTPIGKYITKGVIKDIYTVCSEWLMNWLANKGLIVLNVGAIFVEGKVDQKHFDSAMEEALRHVELSGKKITPEEMKQIDNEVINAFRKFALITKHN